jgi:translation initiation factor IF-3
MNNRSKFYYKNEQIRADQMFVVGSKGEKMGLMSREQALTLAKQEEKDLVLIAPNATPPVAKIIEFGKFLYSQQKKEKPTKQRELKEVRISYNIGEHDLEVKLNHLKKFLAKGHHVRLAMILRGRENMFRNEALDKMRQIASTIPASIEVAPKIEGNNISVQFTP